MKKLTAICFTIISLFFVNATQAQLQDILEEHFEAVGQKKLMKIENMYSTGKIVQMGFEIPFSMTMARPDKLRTEGTFQGQTFIQVYNGAEGWNVNPFAGSLEPQPMGADELKNMKTQSDMDGMLWNWKDKGSTVTYEGKEDVEGTECYKMKVVTKENDTYNYFIDTESLMHIKTNAKIMEQGTEVESDTYMSNFMEVEGVVVPGKIENKYNGEVVMTLVFEKVEFNKEVEDKMFNKPGN